MKNVHGTIWLMAVLLALNLNAAERKSALWGDLEPGPYAVGFKLVTVLDHSRIFHSDAAFRGLAEDIEKARALRIYLWYPAQAVQEHLHLHDYVRMAAEDFDTMPAPGSPPGRDLHLPVPLARGVGDEKRRGLLQEECAAGLEVAPVIGRFPLVVFGQGLYYESPLTQMILAEYLVSQGYVVASCPLLGTYNRLVNRDLVDLETEVRDMEFVISQTRHLPFVDKGRLGVLGFDLGGMAALLLCMRNPEVSAVIILDSAVLTPILPGLPTGSPHYNEDRFNIPWMDITQARLITSLSEADKKNTLFTRKSHGDSYLLLCDTKNHGNFTSYAMFGMENPVPGYWGPIQGNPKLLYETICHFCLRFFDGYLKNDPVVCESLRREPREAEPGSGLISFEFKKGKNPTPFIDDFVYDIIVNGTGKALPRLEEMGAPPASEKVLTWLGYHFLYWWGREKEAVDLFQLLTELFPGSANTFDSLGEAFLVVGDKDRAIENFRKSLQMNPKNTHAQEALKRLEEK
jgi:hypothetical protein